MAPGSRLEELTAKYMQNPRRFFVPLANEYRKSNDLDRAIALCREHLPAQPGHMSGHIVLGTAYFEKGDFGAAREVFLTSVELDDENLIALRHLGDIARSRNEIADARQWYARVLDADPRNDEIERLLRSLGEVPEVPEVPKVAERAEAVSALAPFAVPADALSSTPADIASALSDPTPPGLTAIFSPESATAIAAFDAPASQGRPALPPVPRVPYDRFDLSSLSSEPEPAPAAAVEPESEISVDDGVGFLFAELDELVDPSQAGAATGQSLPSVEEADFSAGITTPTGPRAVPAEPVAEELLSRPEFGALASFASWRTAQERETPSTAAAVPATPAVPASDAAEHPSDMFAAAGHEAGATAPEFITETMAALYARQGFFQQALDVYRALLARSPGDAHLTGKVVEMQLAVTQSSSESSLQDDADKALQFDVLGPDVDAISEPLSMLESMYEASPPSQGIEDEPDFGGGWTAPTDAADDWFADVADVNGVRGGSVPADELFGVAFGEFAQPGRPATGSDASSSRAAPGPVVSIASLFGAPSALAADEAAAEMMLGLAEQMVGRLPKEAPTLPVPDVLELPSAVAGDEGTGASPAPLLSFDRFFSGSGSPPRPRIDTPAARPVTPSVPLAAPPSPPSLSPTFGGVPVVPAAPSVTPATWAAFDQFLPPSPGHLSVTPPAPVPAVTPEPKADAGGKPRVPAPEATVERPRVSTTRPPAAELPVEPIAPAIPDRAAPSEFHRWLEGLT